MTAPILERWHERDSTTRIITLHKVCKELDFRDIGHSLKIGVSLSLFAQIDLSKSCNLKNIYNASTTLDCAKVDVERHQRYISKWCVKDRENTVSIIHFFFFCAPNDDG